MKEFYNSRNGFTLAEVKSSRGTNEVRDELASTEVMNFRCKSERCRLTRDAVGHAFTLAEILIALGIIGIVAVMTIPSLMQNISNKQLTTATNNFNRRFGEALKIMNSQGVLAGRKTTQGFLDELSKVFKVAKVCDNTKLNQCFPKTITWGEKEVDTTTLKKSFNIVDDNWGTDVMGVRFANGVSALLAYNPDCKQDSGNTNLIQVGGNGESVGFSTNNCIAMLYDVSSNKKPNKVGTDIQQTSNVENLGGIVANINGVKVTKIAKANSYSSVRYGKDGELSCDEFKAKYGTKDCCLEDECSAGDYWAGAVKICDGTGNMPTINELVKISQYLYNDDSIGNDKFDLTVNPTRFTELQSYGFPSSLVTYNFSVWASSSVSSYQAYRLDYRTESSELHWTPRVNSFPTIVCVKH